MSRRRSHILLINQVEHEHGKQDHSLAGSMKRVYGGPRVISGTLVEHSDPGLSRGFHGVDEHRYFGLPFHYPSLARHPRRAYRVSMLVMLVGISVDWWV